MTQKYYYLKNSVYIYDTVSDVVKSKVKHGSGTLRELLHGEQGNVHRHLQECEQSIVGGAQAVQRHVRGV